MNTIGRVNVIRLSVAVLAIFALAGAITIALIALPNPAIGGTCGPGKTSSESAIVAFFDPVSIGAGTEPPASDSTARTAWTTFVSECQSSTDLHMAAVLLLVVLAAYLAFVATIVVSHLLAPATPSPPPGWYPDPAGSWQMRWWDGTSWEQQPPPSPSPP